MRPQTSDTFVREIIDIQMRPKTAKLMTQTQLRNLSAKTCKQGLEFTSKPQVEVQYTKFIARNFGVLCDKGYYETNKQIQLQKFGRVQHHGYSQKAKSTQLNLLQQQVKKAQVYKLIDIDSRQRQGPEMITEREKELKYKRQLLQIINDDVQPLEDMYRTFNKNNNVIITKITYNILAKQTNDYQKKKNQKRVKSAYIQLDINEKATACKRSNELYFGKYVCLIYSDMQYQNKKISLDLYAIGGVELVDESQKPKDLELVHEQRRFAVVMPKLIIYCDDISKHATIPLTNLKMSQLIQSNFSDIEKYMVEIDELSNYVLPQKKFPISIQPGKLTKKEKIIKKIQFYEENYMQLAFIPPCIVVSDNTKQLGQYHFNIFDFQALANYCFTNPIQSFMKNCVEVLTLSAIRASVKVQIPEQHDVIQSQQGLACSENGFLLNQTVEKEYKCTYTPAQFECYNPTTTEKQTRIITEKELEQVIDLNFNFTL